MDYRNLSTVSMENVYPLPFMKDMLVHLSKGKIFSKLDLLEAYYHIRIRKGDGIMENFLTPCWVVTNLKCSLLDYREPQLILCN